MYLSQLNTCVEWYAVRCDSKNDYHEDTCLKEIGFLGSLVSSRTTFIGVNKNRVYFKDETLKF